MVTREPQEPEAERRLPPISELSIVTMTLVVIGGTYIAAHIPREVPLLLPAILAVAATLTLLANVFLVSRIGPFAWATFRMVFGWSLVGYGVVAALLAFVFIRDDIPGDVMTFLIAMLAIFAINIPLLFAFSVARYQPVDREG